MMIVAFAIHVMLSLMSGAASSQDTPPVNICSRSKVDANISGNLYYNNKTETDPSECGVTLIGFKPNASLLFINLTLASSIGNVTKDNSIQIQNSLFIYGFQSWQVLIMQSSELAIKLEGQKPNINFEFSYYSVTRCGENIVINQSAFGGLSRVMSFNNHHNCSMMISSLPAGSEVFFYYMPEAASLGNITVNEIQLIYNQSFIIPQNGTVSVTYVVDPVEVDTAGNEEDLLILFEVMRCGYKLPPLPDGVDYLKYPKLPWLNGTQITYSCKPGYQMKFGNTSTCRKVTPGLYTWSNDTEIKCVPVRSCLPLPLNETMDLRLSYDKMTASYTCKEGYRSNSTESYNLTCTSPDPDHVPYNWSSNSSMAYLCSPVSCPDPPYVNNSIANGHNQTYVFKQHITYECAAGYSLHGEGKVICQSNGNWSEAPFCILEPLAMKKGNNHNETVIIACSVAGAVVLAVALVLAVFCRRRMLKQKKLKEKQISPDNGVPAYQMLDGTSDAFSTISSDGNSSIDSPNHYAEINPVDTGRAELTKGFKESKNQKSKEKSTKKRSGPTASEKGSKHKSKAEHKNGSVHKVQMLENDLYDQSSCKNYEQDVNTYEELNPKTKRKVMNTAPQSPPQATEYSEPLPVSYDQAAASETKGHEPECNTYSELNVKTKLPAKSVQQSPDLIIYSEPPPLPARYEPSHETDVSLIENDLYDRSHK